MQRQLPAGIEGAIAYDATKFIDASIKEVRTTLLEAALIVVVVIFLFLGDVRSTLIPIVTIPPLPGRSDVRCWRSATPVDLLTLLALVLAIGLIINQVDHHHQDVVHGHMRRDTARRGRPRWRPRNLCAGDLDDDHAGPPPYAPIGFVSGLTGALFREFAFTLAGAIVVSGIIVFSAVADDGIQAVFEARPVGRPVRSLSRSHLRRPAPPLPAPPRPAR